MQFLQYQKLFPLKPLFEPESLLHIDMHDVERLKEKEFVKLALQELDKICSENFNKSFKDGLLKHAKAGIQKRPTPTERKREKRAVLRECRNAINKQFADTAAKTVLTEDESLSSYQRKRLSQSFEKPPEAKRHKSHSPNFDRVEWDKEKVITDLKQYPKDKPINWSQFAKEHDVPGSNGGQVVKQYAQQNGIDTIALDNRSPDRRLRSQHKRMPGGEVSIPCNPTPKSIKKSWSDMIESGELSLGEPCTPYTLTKYITREGIVSTAEVPVYSRKFSLLSLRKKLLKTHEKYMRLPTDSDLATLTHTQLVEACRRFDTSTEADVQSDELCHLLARCQRQRSLVIWHDHATVLNSGFIMVTVHILYDDAVFFTNEEYQQKHNQNIDIQSEVEQPEIHMLALSSPSIEDQAALLPERVACLHDLSETITASNGVELIDRLHFFTGDKPAAQFERGTQIGGTYKCGGCGCKDVMMDDQAHSLRCTLRSFEDLQDLAVSGIFGKQPNVLKPFDQLLVAQLKQELLARKFYETDQPKPQLSQILVDMLKGVQRVPSLLLLNPSQPVSHLNLQLYTILDSEPLHDLKGHILNLFSELPYILPESVKGDCEARIKLCTSKDKTTGADLRCCLIEVYLLLCNAEIDGNIVLLLASLVRMSEILYSSYEVRNPRQVLALYNNAWLHHELCRELLNPLHISRTKMFGNYLHALSSHAPQQHEILCLKSVNTENHERFFGQARRSASLTSNRTPENIIFNILLRLQAKRSIGNLLNPIHKSDSQVRRAASNLKKLSGTRFSKSFVSRRKHSWQAHLERISPFLVYGKGVWWHDTDEDYSFLDGATDPEYHLEGPQLLHYRSSTLKDVTYRQRSCWQTILRNSIEIPTETINIYDKEGELSHTVHNSHTSTENLPSQPSSTEPSSTFSDTPSHLDNTKLMDNPKLILSGELSKLDTDQDHSIDRNVEQVSITDPEAHNSPEHETTNPSFDSETQITSLSPIPELQSKLCKAISRVVGTTQRDNLLKLDSLHLQLKQLKQRKGKASSHDKKVYKDLLSSFRTLALGKRVLIQNEITAYEKRFYKENNCLPTTSDNPHFRELMSQKNYANKLLQSWNISL